MSQRLVEEYEAAVRDHDHATPGNRGVYLERLEDAGARLSRRMLFKSAAMVVLSVALFVAVAT